MAKGVAAKHVPFPKLAVYGSGVLIALGGAGILFGVMVPVAVLLLEVFLIPVTLIMHSFWQDTDPAAKMQNQISFAKNTALAGAALAYLFVPTPWPFSF